VDKYCLMFYHEVEGSSDLFKTAIKTFKKVSDAQIVVFSDNIDESNDYTLIKIEDPIEARMYSKILCLHNFLKTIKYGSQVLVADVDLYFLSDPFKAFDLDFDLGLTTRMHKHKSKPINAGVFFLRYNNLRILTLINYWLLEMRKTTWDTYKKFRNFKYGLDWDCDQSFLNACWADKSQVEEKFNIRILDVGPEYNYCPADDILGFENSRMKLLQTYLNKSAVILHLKSKLKLCLYEGWLEDAVTENKTGIWNWQKAGKK